MANLQLNRGHLGQCRVDIRLISQTMLPCARDNFLPNKRPIAFHGAHLRQFVLTIQWPSSGSATALSGRPLTTVGYRQQRLTSPASSNDRTRAYDPARVATRTR